jgi:hypothetical protein
VLVEPSSSPEPTSVSITRLVCLTLVVLAVLLGGGLLLLIRPEYSNVAIALIGVVVGASFGLVSASRPRPGRDKAA